MNSKSDDQSLTVVVPVYNEGENLHRIASSAIEFCRTYDWDIIFINDGSRDSTGKILNELATSPKVRVIHHKVNRGYGGALKTGISHVTTTYLVTIDGDGQHDLNDIEYVFRFALEQNADMVIGKRNERQTTTLYRSLGKLLIRSFTKTLVPLSISDLNSGFKLYRTELAKRYITVCPDSMAFSDVITLVFLNEFCLVLEYPIRVLPRTSGQSTITTFTAFETIIQVLNIALMFNPLKVFLPISALCILAGLGWGIPIVLLGRGVSVGAMLAIVTGFLFFVLGLLASQLSAIRMERLRDLTSGSRDGQTDT
jgi:glycosyltransferase involved in cell wall biosynthesis